MKKIWAPWRNKYILNKEPEEGCILCNRIRKPNDEDNYILYRGKLTFIIMNIYPYNNGHLMVAPNKHTSLLENLDTNEGKELFSSLTIAVRLLKSVFKPDGFNLGMNLGKVAGAGIEDHLHIHIVPRWNGDTNFMPVLANTKILSISLDETYKLLKKNIGLLL